jgi:pyruvate formate lyase activating enzyme
LDTSGNPFSTEPAYLQKFDRLMAVTDLFMLDIKEMDEERHKKLTGQPNENILAMGDYISSHGGEMWVRHVLVPELTDDEEGLYQMRKKIDSWENVSRVEVLPYHTLGLFKWEKSKIPYSLAGVQPPTEEEVKRAEKILVG